MISEEERKLAREKALEKHKKRRAKTIARIRRRRIIDTYIKSRVYIVLAVSVLLVILFALDKRETNKKYDQQIVNHNAEMNILGNMIEKLSHDNLLDINTKLARSIDSLQIIVVVYHRRFMSDQKTIQYLLSFVPYNERQKIINKHRGLILPNYFLNDSDVYKYGIDTLYDWEGDSVKYYEADSLGLLN